MNFIKNWRGRLYCYSTFMNIMGIENHLLYVSLNLILTLVSDRRPVVFLKKSKSKYVKDYAKPKLTVIILNHYMDRHCCLFIHIHKEVENSDLLSIEHSTLKPALKILIIFYFLSFFNIGSHLFS